MIADASHAGDFIIEYVGTNPDNNFVNRQYRLPAITAGDNIVQSMVNA